MITINKLHIAFGLIFTTLFLMSVTFLAFADNTQKPARFIVVFEKGAFQDKQNQDELASSVDGKVALPLSFMNAVAIEVPEKAAAQILANKPGVEAVYEDMEMTLVKRTTPIPEPTELLDWGVDIIDADVAWPTNTGLGIKVAVLDTGMYRNHPDLNANVKGGVGFVARERWYTDGNGHGTHVSGTIAAVDNTIGVVGVANQASLYGVQVLSRTGTGYLSSLLSGIDWAIQNDMDVISMSLAFTPGVDLAQLPGLKEQLDAAETAGIVVVAAAGNDGLNAVSYPAAYPTVVAVAATNKDDSLATYSNWGEGVDVAAPGTDIRSTWNNGSYLTISGTSMATPHISGVAALILKEGVIDENANGKVNDEVRARIAESTKPVIGHSFGRIDAIKALHL